MRFLNTFFSQKQNRQSVILTDAPVKYPTPTQPHTQAERLQKRCFWNQVPLALNHMMFFWVLPLSTVIPYYHLV